jgi:hypothetical protein
MGSARHLIGINMTTTKMSQHKKIQGTRVKRETRRRRK